MKKLIKWLAKVFKANITVEKIIYKEKVVYKPLEDKLSGSISLDGNLLVDGTIEATEDIVCYKTKIE
ncbi:hypothetical protein [Parabacteroides gordonii]|uniref:Uncharacterized protein n=1 Tax=Parabacteroides gordonii MS-1 = DSM 23371 TaxID=1203610 RepID=A0A0F5JDJ3_9BACT|nr:hypothetical protein [Parabacteroides gordonii]KKB55560.1 hypothetical protein HMPREF1536_03031 [Parabacteroides gordonii MS-1 = DSM 23371]MCA5581653.1 hypothetical protein [Parabacteroides gordonii]RGP18096.1 hypothetical protein DXB27_01330 [Parabacteroides gordonii]